MAHLSSCYFCGTALDEPLGTYGVGEGRTVTLCPTCRRKLETILEASGAPLSSVDGPQPATVTTPDEATADSDGEPGDSGPGVATDRDPSPDDGEAAETLSADDVTGNDPATTDDAATADVDTARSGADSLDDALAEERETDLSGEAEDDDTADDGAGSTASDPDDVNGEHPSGAGTEVAEDGASVGEDPFRAGTGPDGTDESGGADSEEGTDDADSADGTPRASLSALEYNKVMRLLKNREFPVDRAEIEAVAANAYDLPPSDCAAVIDLAVERGLLEETDGQLSRPESG